jgi:FtsP/CotA-like multicopper oxidase with cupredoxin domain
MNTPWLLWTGLSHEWIATIASEAVLFHFPLMYVENAFAIIVCMMATRPFFRENVFVRVFQWTALSSFFLLVPLTAQAQSNKNVCPRSGPGSVVPEPADLHSKNGILEADLVAQNTIEADGRARYCFTDANGHESPNLRVHPGDRVILRFTNSMQEPQSSKKAGHVHAGGMPQSCTSSIKMDLLSTNLHFHGLTIPPTCHQDDVLKTSLQPGDPPFTYSFQIPEDETPGLYWYHPHIHGFSKQQLLGGASAALIVEGIEGVKKETAGLPERVFVIRDEDLANPNAPQSKSEPVVPKFMVDRDGDAANNGTGFGKPAKDLSINYVPVPYPDYPPALIQMRPGERQLWRVLNATAITYLDLSVVLDHKSQPLELVAMDGSPLGAEDPNGAGARDEKNVQTHLGVPPGARVEFVIEPPPEGKTALLVTHTVDTGPGGENDPNRMLARVVASADAPEPVLHLEGNPKPLPAAKQAWLGDVRPTRVRSLYFSEKLADPNDPTSATEFYLTVDGQSPKAFDMNAMEPNIVAEQGTVEDWIIENRSQELHAFHIHQLHFLLLDYMGRPVEENFLRDTVNVPYYNGHTLAYPSIRIRVDLRDPNVVGTFPYHCHLLEHEDKGMMGIIQVLPAKETISIKTVSAR